MRIWVNPDKMAKLGLTATDVSQRDSGAEPAESRRAPSASRRSPRGTDFQYPVNASGRLLDPQQFGDIVLRAEPDGSLLRLRDIGRVELGAQDYNELQPTNGKPASIIIVYLSPGANAVETADRVTQFMEEREEDFPAGH